MMNTGRLRVYTRSPKVNLLEAVSGYLEPNETKTFTVNPNNSGHFTGYLYRGMAGLELVTFRIDTVNQLEVPTVMVPNVKVPCWPSYPFHQTQRFGVTVHNTNSERVWFVFQVPSCRLRCIHPGCLKDAILEELTLDAHYCAEHKSGSRDPCFECGGPLGYDDKGPLCETCDFVNLKSERAPWHR